MRDFFSLDALKVMGVDYNIVYENKLRSEEDEKLLGQAVMDKVAIMIEKDMPQQLKEITILHELLHVIDISIESKLKENQVEKLSRAFYAFLHENNLKIIKEEKTKSKS
jgi:hypothetical protein